MLLDGFGMHGALWLPFVLPLAGRYRFLLPDLRGFGFSHRFSLAAPSAIGQPARDVDDLITGLDLHDDRFGGRSMGASPRSSTSGSTG